MAVIVGAVLLGAFWIYDREEGVDPHVAVAEARRFVELVLDGRTAQASNRVHEHARGGLPSLAASFRRLHIARALGPGTWESYCENHTRLPWFDGPSPGCVVFRFKGWEARPLLAQVDLPDVTLEVWVQQHELAPRVAVWRLTSGGGSAIPCDEGVLLAVCARAAMRNDSMMVYDDLARVPIAFTPREVRAAFAARGVDLVTAIPSAPVDGPRTLIPSDRARGDLTVEVFPTVASAVTYVQSARAGAPVGRRVRNVLVTRGARTPGYVARAARQALDDLAVGSS